MRHGLLYTASSLLSESDIVNGCIGCNAQGQLSLDPVHFRLTSYHSIYKYTVMVGLSAVLYCTVCKNSRCHTNTIPNSVPNPITLLTQLTLIVLGCVSCVRLFNPLTPAVPNCCCSKGPASYWCNLPFLIFDIRALWRSRLSARVPECQN